MTMKSRLSIAWICLCVIVVGASRADTGQLADSTSRVRQMYDGHLSPNEAVATFSHIDRLFPTRTVHHGTHVYPLPDSARRLTNFSFTSRGKKWDLYDYLAVNRIAGLLMLKDGQIVFENYQLGTDRETRWMSMSVAKSITSTLFGAAIKQGLIGSINDPATKYAPELAGSAYEGVSIRDILMMSSGVKWNETYTDPRSDRRHLLEAQISQQPGAALAVMKSLPRAAPPGTVNNYSTGETQIAGIVLHGAIHRPLADYLSERIWSRFGMEDDATWWLASTNGMEIAGSGFSARLRDYARFGLFFLNGGVAGGEHLLPDGWMQEAGSPKVLKGGKKLEYGYFWWPAWSTDATPDAGGAFSAIGIFGQYLYINPKEHVVIAEWSARSKPGGMDIIDDMDFFAAATVALQETAQPGRQQ
jgi:CubicO group peptidase (beta-lactamase class C family)